MSVSSNAPLSVVSDEKQHLILNFSEFLGYECIVKLTPWINGVTWSGSGDSSSTHTFEELGVPFSLFYSAAEASPWIKTFPDGLPDQLVSYEIKYRSTIYGLLWCISRSSHACELFSDAPVLAWLIIRSAYRNQWGAEYTLSLFSQKRTTILEACGLTSSKTVLKLILKCRFIIFGSHEYDLIIKLHLLVMNKSLSHLSFIDERLVKLIDRFPQFQTSKLINQFGQNWCWNTFDQNFEDSLLMGSQLDIPDILSLIFSCKSIHCLENLHNKLVVKLNERKCRDEPLIYYIEPPLLGNDFIIPITNNHDLNKEGAIQHHCVASYHKQIYLGEYYVYKILKPER